MRRLHPLSWQHIEFQIGTNIDWPSDAEFDRPFHASHWIIGVMFRYNEEKPFNGKLKGLIYAGKVYDRHLRLAVVDAPVSYHLIEFDR